MAASGSDIVRHTAIRGHALLFEGQALTPHDGDAVPWEPTYRLTHKSEGTAYCECGEHSGVLPSTAARQRWHAQHKDEVRPAPDTGLLWCPSCGKQGLTRTGCRDCGATAEDIERIEPGPWDEWGH